MGTQLDSEGDFDSDYYLKESILKFEYAQNKESEWVANELKVIFSSIRIEPEEAHDFISSIVSNVYDFNWLEGTRSNVSKFYPAEEVYEVWGDDADYLGMEEEQKNEWLYENVGSKSLKLYVDDDIKSTTFGLAPEGFLKRLYKICSERWEDVCVMCKWYNEGEDECGIIVIENDILAEDMRVLDVQKIFDYGYFVKGDEDIDDVVQFLNTKLPNLSLDGLVEDEIRIIFENYKDDERWIRIGTYFDNMFIACRKAIESEDFKFPILTCKKIC